MRQTSVGSGKIIFIFSQQRTLSYPRRSCPIKKFPFSTLVSSQEASKAGCLSGRLTVALYGQPPFVKLSPDGCGVERIFYLTRRANFSTFLNKINPKTSFNAA